MIQKHTQEFPVKMMCRVLSVSTSGYYAWCSRKVSKRKAANKRVGVDVKRIFEKHKGRLGALRITFVLRASGEKIGRHRVRKLMQEQGLRARATKKYKATTQSKHHLPVAPNLLAQNFTALCRNEKWVSDITYIGTEEGWVYLATVMDLYTRKIIGWCLSRRITVQITENAMKMAIGNNPGASRVIVHSDRGSQYCAASYQDILKAHDLICSMSAKGNCFDNASMESWNHSFKVEAIHGEKFKTRESAQRHIFEYIEVYYNRIRPHSKLDYMSPECFEAKMSA